MGATPEHQPAATRPLYAIGIVASPVRMGRARSLAMNTEADIIVCDDRKRGERWCHTEALRQLATLDADWCVLLEDDALPIDDFRPSLSRALADTQPAIISLYLGQGRWAGSITLDPGPVQAIVNHAEATNARWIDSHPLWHAVALAVPTMWAQSLTTWLDTHPTAHTEQATNGWTKAHGRSTRYTWPSLVDHGTGPSVLPHPYAEETPRVAWRTGPWPDADAQPQGAQSSSPKASEPAPRT